MNRRDCESQRFQITSQIANKEKDHKIEDCEGPLLVEITKIVTKISDRKVEIRC